MWNKFPDTKDRPKGNNNSRQKSTSTIVILLSVIIVLGSTGTTIAAVWTDQDDYTPGSIVTISGDNSDDAGYLPGETVTVRVDGPYNYDSSCSAIVDESSTWSCQITLSSDETAIGNYVYTATGQTSGVRQSGTFTDGTVISAPINVRESTCTTDQTTFTLGDTVCARTQITVQGSGTGDLRMQWINSSGTVVRTDTLLDMANGDVNTSTYVPGVTGTWTVKTCKGATGQCGGGNILDSKTFTINAPAPTDTTPPVITPTVSGTLGNNGWYVSDVTVSWSVTDPESAITPTGCGSTTINADTASQTLTCSATSAGGTSSQSVNIKRDATPPTISGSASPIPNANGWNNGNVTVSFICSDAMSGMASCGPGQTLSEEDAGQSATGTAVDLAGNSASATVSDINIDKTAPTISANATANGGLYTSGSWTNKDVTVSFSCSDVLSGLDGSCPSDVTVSDEGAGQSVSRTITDKAGNVASATFEEINIDKTAPSILCGSADGDWHANDVSIACTAEDDGSGLDEEDESFQLSTNVPDGTETSNAETDSKEVCDKVGNCATAGPIDGNKVDKKVPSISISSPTATTYTLNQAVTATYSCTDSGSGIDTCTGTVASGTNINTATIGSKTFSVTATDNAGNSKTEYVQYNVIYNFNGFFQPIDNNGVFNVAKAGSAIPVKFSLNGNQGLNIFAVGYPRSQVISCNPGALNDQIEETVTAGQSGLSYDASKDQYNYVWKTDKSWNGCRKLQVMFIDGRTYTADFKFTK